MTDNRLEKYKLANEYNEKLKEWRCYSTHMDYIAFSGYGETEEKAELNYHIKMSEMIINRPKIFADAGA